MFAGPVKGTTNDTGQQSAAENFSGAESGTELLKNGWLEVVKHRNVKW
jgi:hypothetical protein